MRRLLCVLVLIAAMTGTTHAINFEGVANILRTLKGLLVRIRGDSEKLVTNPPPAMTADNTHRRNAFEGQHVFGRTQQFGNGMTLEDWKLQQDRDRKLELLKQRIRYTGGW